MGKRSTPAPTPPDPKETAAAQTGTNVSTAIANTVLGNVDQSTPDGSLTYDQSGSYSWTDPSTGQTHTAPRFTATQTLSPEQTAIKSQTDAAELNLAETANQQSAFMKDYIGRPVDLSSGNVDSYINTHFGDDFKERWDRTEADMETKLANQGIKRGSEAYTRAVADLSQNRNDAHDNLYGNLYGQAQSAITAERNQPINEIGALLSGSQVNQPNYVNANTGQIPTTDYAGLVNQNYQQRLGIWQQEQAQRERNLGGLFGLGQAFLGALNLSDERAKKDIEPVGKLGGHKLYEYHYKGESKDDPKSIGVMAQEVEKTRPDAVVKGADGLRRVKYGQLFGIGG
jgi:hypothetical protein